MKSKFYLILAMSALLTGCQSVAQTVTPTNHHCRNLQKVSDIDDLLYQMYSNIDSQCLFTMSTEQLARIWDIPIFDYTKIDVDKEEDREKNRSLFLQRQKLDESPTPSYYLFKDIDYDSNNNVRGIYFRVFRNNVHLEQYPHYEGSLAKGRFPYYLPKPTIYINNGEIIDAIRHTLPSIPKDTHYNSTSKYIWCNSRNHPKSPFLVLESSLTPSVSIIYFINNQQDYPLCD